jgi:uncharacterized damage-inducible protein DinB
MTRRELRRLIQAHDTVWGGWWPTLVNLPDSLAHRRLRGSFPTVFATIVHMVETELYWQDRLEARPERNNPSGWNTMAQVERAWTKLRKRRLAWVATTDLRREVRFEAAGGYRARVSVGECLIHVTTHAHFHRGQLASQCRQLGIAPPSRHLLGGFFGEYSSVDRT